MAAMQQTVADKKLNSRILIQFFFLKYLPDFVNILVYIFFQNGRQYGCHAKQVVDEKLNSRILTHFFPTISPRLHEHLRQLFVSKWLPIWPPCKKTVADKN